MDSNPTACADNGTPINAEPSMQDSKALRFVGGFEGATEQKQVTVGHRPRVKAPDGLLNGVAK